MARTKWSVEERGALWKTGFSHGMSGAKPVHRDRDYRDGHYTGLDVK